MQSAPEEHLNEKWLKSSLIGSLWAAVEIIFGSFLHNMKVPFSGTVLTFISVFLLISFFQVWKEKGIIIRAGLICAAMKSISPSAVILGPMIGILTEAFLLEMMIRFAGTNLFSYLVGGALAVLSALFHKVFMLIILYGFNLVKLAEEFYYFIIKQVNLSGINPYYLIGFILSIHILFGLTASFLGYLSGRKLSLEHQDSLTRLDLQGNQMNKELFISGNFHKYSLFHLLVIISGTIVSLAFLNLSNFLFAFVLSLLFLTYAFIWYSTILRKFKKPMIWTQFAIIIISSSVLFTSVSGGIHPVFQGFVTGLKMIVRAIVIIVGFSSLSIELRNPVIGNFLIKNGFKNLYRSLSISFSVLPVLISEIENNRSLHANSKKRIENMIIRTIHLLKYFEADKKETPGNSAGTGPK